MDSPDTAPTTAKVGTVYRGKLTGSQVFLACVLGSMLGFVPGFVQVEDLQGGFMQAPGLILSLLALVLILRCSVVIFLITAAGAKLLSVPLGAASFFVGRILLDGPTSSLFEIMINAPFLAWFGLEYYETSGGLLVGLVVGIVWAFLLRAILRRAATEEEIAARKWRMPVRLLGIVAVLVLTGGAWLMQSWLGSRAIKDALRGGLEAGNGATVDLAALDLDLSGGKVTLDGLSMADPNKLTLDLFRAAKLEMKLGTTALLSRRLVIESITTDAAETGARRDKPGKRIHPRSAPKPPEPKEGEKTLEDYLAEAKVWEERLAQAQHWFETIFRTEDAETSDERARRIEEEIATRGRSSVAARHLIRGAPLLLVKKIDLRNIAIVTGGAGDKMSIEAFNISTNPGLVDSPPEIKVRSNKDTFGLELKLDTASGGVAGKLFHNAIPVDAIASQLKSGDGQPIRGGNLAISLGGLMKSGDDGFWIDFPLKVALQNTTLSLKGMKPTPVEKLELPLGLRGPLTALRIKLDDTALVDALVAAGKAELANELKRQTDKLLGEKVPPELKGVVKKAIDGDAEKAAKKAAEEAAKKAEEELKKKAEKELNKGLKKVLPISVGGEKKNGKK